MYLPASGRRGGALCGTLALCTCLAVPLSLWSQSADKGSPSAAPVPPVYAAPAQRERGARLYLRGAHELEESDFAGAEKHFTEAYGADPNRADYLQAATLAREHRITGLVQQAASARPLHPEQADKLLAQARAIDANNPRLTQHSDMLAPVSATPRPPASAGIDRRILLEGALQVKPISGVKSFHLTADARSMAGTITAAYGVRVVMDPDLQSKQLRLDVDDVPYADAIRIFAMLSGTFATPLDEHSILLAQDTAQNRQRLEHLLEEVIPLLGYSVEQINDVANVCKSIFDLKQVSIEPQMQAITVRAPEDTLQAVNDALTDLLDSNSEVVIDLKLYSIDTEKARHVGVVLPSAASAFNVLSAAQTLVNANSALVQQLISSGAISSTATTTQIALALLASGLATGTGSLSNLFFVFGGGLTQTGLSLANFPTINLLLRESDARTLDDVVLRAGDRQAATFKSGTRYPIQTSLYSDVSTTAAGANSATAALIAQYLGTSSLASSATIPQVQYEDLGVTLKATPHVQRTGQITLHLEFKIEALSGTALNGIPVLASRQFSSDLTLKDGETALMASNVTRSELRAATGIPGLSELPGFQVPTDKSSDKITGDLVVLITPHIVHLAHTQAKGPFIQINSRPETE